MKASQLLFGWFEAGLNRSGVLSLCVFRPEVIHSKMELAEGVVSDVGKEKLTGGQVNQSIAYSTWLKFFSPLSPSYASSGML